MDAKTATSGEACPIRVLAIEDDPQDFALTRALLSPHKGDGFQCEQAETLEIGLGRLAAKEADVVLLDLKLPDAQGLDTYLRLRAREPEVPVVLLTGTEDEEMAMMAIEKGAQDYLVKGKVDRDQMVRSIRYAIERTRSEAALRRYRDHLEELVMARTSELRLANDQLQVEVGVRRRIEEEKDRLQAEIVEARKLEAVGRLAGGIAHEFNNTLTIVLGYAELLLDRMDGANPLRDDVRRIIEAGEHAASLTHQLLAFGRRQMMQAKIIDANVFAAGMKVVIEPVVGDKIDVTLVPSEEAVCIEIDEDQMQTAMINIVCNARDAMRAGGQLVLRVENVIVDRMPSGVEGASGGFVCLSIEDTGSGMDHETLEHIFEPFFTTKKFGQGTGLGLTVTYGIVRQHGGWIEASSHQGGGSVFRIFLPALAADESALPVEQRPKNGTATRGHGELVLLVEDAAGVREFLHKALKNRGYQVAVAASAAEARSVFAGIKDSCRLLFADVVLRRENGIDLADELLSVRGDLRVLLSSGYGDGEYNGDRIRERGYAFISKPYTITALMATLRMVFEREPVRSAGATDRGSP